MGPFQSAVDHVTSFEKGGLSSGGGPADGRAGPGLPLSLMGRLLEAQRVNQQRFPPFFPSETLLLPSCAGFKGAARPALLPPASTVLLSVYFPRR